MPKVILGRGVHARPLSLRGFFLYTSVSHRLRECRSLDFLRIVIRCLATQEKRMRSSRRIRSSRTSECAATWFVIPTEEVNLDNLNFSDWVSYLKRNLKSQSLRSRPWLIAFVYCFIALLAICPERLNAIKQYIMESKQHQKNHTEVAIDHEIWRGLVWVLVYVE